MFKNKFIVMLCVFTIIALWIVPPISASNYFDIVIEYGYNRVDEIYGSLEFTVLSGSAIIGDVEVKPGDKVYIYIHRLINDGWIYIHQNGWTHIYLPTNTTVYVNDRLVLENGAVELQEIYIDLSTLNSTLTLHIYPEPSGYLRLVINGTTVINDPNDSSDVLIEGLRASTSRALVLSLCTSIPVNVGLASRVLVNGSDIPVVSTKLLPVIVLTVLTTVFLLKYLGNYRVNKSSKH